MPIPTIMAGSRFTLASIGGAQGVYAARMESAYANNDPVGTLKDFSAGGHPGSNTAGGRPTFLTGQINGLPAFSFDGAAQCFKVNGLVSGFTGSDLPHSVVMVLKNTDLATNYTFFSAGRSSDNNPFVQYLTRSGPLWRFTREDDTATNATDSQGTPTTNASIIVITFTGTTLTMRHNGTVVMNASAADVGTLTLDQVTIGANGRAAYTGFYKGLIAEVGVWFRALSAGECSFAAHQLGAMYGIAVA